MKVRALFGLSVLLATTAVDAAKPVVVGSKKFTESYVLGGIAKTVLERAGFAVQERAGMGGTIILWQALRGAQIDVYPEYTGTIGEEILKTKQPLSEDEMRKALAEIQRRHVRGPRLQQHLRARHASHGSRKAGHSDDQRSPPATRNSKLG